MPTESPCATRGVGLKRVVVESVGEGATGTVRTPSRGEADETSRKATLRRIERRRGDLRATHTLFGDTEVTPPEEDPVQRNLVQKVAHSAHGKAHATTQGVEFRGRDPCGEECEGGRVHVWEGKPVQEFLR